MALGIVTKSVGIEKTIRRCNVCGREFHPQYNEDYYCSAGCRKKARLDYWREKGKKTLAKWEEALEKDKSRISKLSTAIRGDDPDAIATAIKGSFFKRCVKCLLIIVAIILMLPGILIIVNIVTPRASEGHSEVVNELPPLEDTSGTTNTVATPTAAREAPVKTAVVPAEGDSISTAK